MKVEAKSNDEKPEFIDVFNTREEAASFAKKLKEHGATRVKVQKRTYTEGEKEVEMLAVSAVVPEEILKELGLDED